MMKYLILCLFFLFSCSKKEEAPVEKPTGVKIEALGAVNFGGVVVGQYRDAALKVTNYGPNSVNLDFTLEAPFSIVSRSESCSQGTLSVSASCIISVRFRPTASIDSSFPYTIGNQSITFTGKGLLDGVLEIENPSWNLNTVVAGTEVRKSFRFNNLGDLTIAAPSFDLPDYVRVGFNQCGAFIAARASCQIELISEATQKGLINTLIPITGEGGVNIAISLTGEILPGPSAGIISFESFPLSMEADGEEFVLRTQPIRDEFNNIVAENTPVAVSVNSLLLSVDGNSFQTDASGRISFRVRTLTTKGTGAISLSSQDASGFYSFPITAGPVFGTINFESFNQNLIANGVSNVIIQTEILRDLFGNVVEDGTEVFFNVVGDASVSNTSTPQEFTAFTLNGVAKAIMKAGTTAGQVTLEAKSGPIYDNNNILLGYSGNGSTSVNLIPGLGSGVIPITSDFPAIYADRNGSNPANLATETLVTLGPIRDEFNNIVSEGNEVNIVVTNALILSGGSPRTSATFLTNSSGIVTFTLSGNDQRGQINIEAASAFATGSLDLWAYNMSIISYNNNSEDVSLYFRHADAQNAPLANIQWSPMKDLNSLSFLDGNFIGLRKTSALPQTAFSLSEGIPYFTWDCFFTADTFLMASLCLRDDGFYEPFFIYNRNNQISYEAFATNTNPELLLNGNFSPALQNQYWSQSGGQVTWSSDYDGSYRIDNSFETNGADPNNPLNPKFEGRSDWFLVEPGKQYVVTARMVARFGSDIYGDGEIGVVFGDENLYLDPAYEEPRPIILKENLNQSAVGVEQRMLFIVPDGIAAARIHLSTRGDGNGALTYWDNVSVKESLNGNFHDNLVSEGPSFSYLKDSDRLVVFGGSTLQGDSNGYSSYVSDKLTTVERILDPSVGLISNTIDSSSSSGDYPFNRTHSSFTATDNLIYTFGGYNNQDPNGLAFDDLFTFNGYEWNKLDALADPTLVNEQGEGGKPSARYQNGIAVVEQLNKVFVLAGLSQDIDTPGLWFLNEDLWSYDISLNQWTELCNDCGIFGTNPYPIISDVQVPLENFPEIQERYDNYVETIDNLKRTNMIWNQAEQVMYIHIPEERMLAYNPYTNVFFEPTEAGVKDFFDAFQVMYNKKTGRTYAYKRGNKGSRDSKIFYWDMNPDQKQYIKADIKLSSEAETYLRYLKIDVVAHGQSLTERPSGFESREGVEMFLFNHLNQEWEIVDLNEASTSGDAQSDILSVEFSSFALADYVNNEKVNILLTPKGRPGIDGGEALMGDDLLLVDLGLNDSSDPLLVEKIINTNNSSCALVNNEGQLNVKCWGKNDFGQLGLASSTPSIGESAGEMGDNLSYLNLFNEENVQNTSLSVTNVYAGGNHVCSLFNNERIKCWGKNDYGQLGLGDTINRGQGFSDMGDNLLFVDLGTDDGTGGTAQVRVKKVSLGLNHSCAIVNNGLADQLKCWGDNSFGQLGYGDNQNRGGPNSMGNNLPYIDLGTSLGNPFNIEDVFVGDNFTCAVREDNTLWCWGDNSSGQIGQEQITASYNSPQLVDLNQDSIFFAHAGSNHACAYIQESVLNVLKCWGKNNVGQLGYGDDQNRGDNSAEMGVFLNAVNYGVGDLISISLGDSHTCVLTDNNEVKCFGDNTFGQIAYGPTINSIGTQNSDMGSSLASVNLGLNFPVDFISSGSLHNCVLSNKQLKCWGDNTFGQLGLEDQRQRGKGFVDSQGFNELFIDFIEVQAIY